MKSFAIRSVEKQVLHYVQDDNIYDKNFWDTLQRGACAVRKRWI
jgi:hypothetical protein